MISPAHDGAGRRTDLSPASIDPEIAIAALLPMTGLPGRSLIGSLLVMAGKPSPLAPGPSPMTGLPIDRRAWRGRGVFGHRLWRRIRRIIYGLRVCRTAVPLAIGIGNACRERSDNRQAEHDAGCLDDGIHVWPLSLALKRPASGVEVGRSLSRMDESRLSRVARGYGSLRRWANRDIKANENRTALDRLGICPDTKFLKVGQLFPWAAGADRNRLP